MARSILDQESVFIETTLMWCNPLIKFLIPFEVVINSVIIGLVAWKSPGTRAGLLSVWVLACLGLPVLLMMVRLKTDLSHETLRVGFWPIPGWRIGVERIVRAEHRKIDPLNKLGGWGVKYKKEFGVVLNVVGEDHVIVTLDNGKKRTIGTREPGALMDALRFVCDLDGEGYAPGHAPDAEA